MLVNITTALERYLRHHRASNSSPKTLEWHQSCGGQFASFLENPDIGCLYADDLRRWIVELQGRNLV